jgi:hypothetical protein
MVICTQHQSLIKGKILPTKNECAMLPKAFLNESVVSPSGARAMRLVVIYSRQYLLIWQVRGESLYLDMGSGEPACLIPCLVPKARARRILTGSIVCKSAI